MLGTLSPEALDRVYSESDAFVLASHYEGYGTAYAEALRDGLPVIGNDGRRDLDTVPFRCGDSGRTRKSRGVVCMDR